MKWQSTYESKAEKILSMKIERIEWRIWLQQKDILIYTYK